MNPAAATEPDSSLGLGLGRPRRWSVRWRAFTLRDKAAPERRRKLSLGAWRLGLLWMGISAAAVAATTLQLWLTQTEAALQTARATLATVEARLDLVANEMQALGAPEVNSGCGQEQVRKLVDASLSSVFVRRFSQHEPGADFTCTPTGPEGTQQALLHPGSGLTITSGMAGSPRLLAAKSFGGAEGPAWLAVASLDDRVFEGAVALRRDGVLPHNVMLKSGSEQLLGTLASASSMRGSPVWGRDGPAVQALAESPRHGIAVAVDMLPGDLATGALRHAAVALLVTTAITSLVTLLVWRLAVRRARLVNRISVGLRKRQFEPHVQPIVDLSTGRCVGGEVLMRWHHPQRGVLSPFEFIEEAERTGLIVGMSDLVMVRAAQRLAQLARQQPGLYFSFNVTPQQLCQPGFAQRLEEIFNNDTLPRHQVLLELTERDFVDNATRTALDALQHAGWRIAIDDFGTGQSSLATLEQLRVDRIKIDRAFVRTIDQHTLKRPVLDAIIALASQLHVQLIAEGVETQAQWDYLRERGVQYAQGYLFAKPLSIEDFIGWLGRSQAVAADTDSDAGPAPACRASAPPVDALALNAQARALWQLMRSPDGLKIRTRTHGLRTHADCFVGSEAVDWLARHRNLDRAGAVRLGRQLMALGMIQHVVHEHDFKDDSLFYRLCHHQSPKVNVEADAQLAAALRSAQGPRWRPHARGLLMHSGCVTGRELVNWMVARKGIARDTATQWAAQWMRQGVLRHVYDDEPVRDDRTLYRLG